MSATEEILPIPPQPEISEGNKVFHQKAYDLYKWMRTKLGPAIIEEANLIRNAVTGAFTATSSTSMAITAGEKTLDISPGRSFMPGTPVRVARTSAPENYLDGITKTYDVVTGEFVFEGVTPNGSGTFTDWSISIIPSSGGGLASLFTNKFTGQQSLANEVDVSSAAGVLDLTASGTNQVKIVSSEDITAVNMPQGAVIIGRGGNAFKLVNSTGLKIPGAADINIALNDKLIFIKDADGNVQVMILPISGRPLRLKNTANDPTFASSDGSPISDVWIKGLLALLLGGLKIGKTAYSAAYTPAFGETLSMPHGLTGNIPVSGTLVLECISADLGRVPGEHVNPFGMWTGSVLDPLPSVSFDATNCSIKCPSGYLVYITHKTTGIASTPATGKWKYAFKFTY